MCYTVQLLAQLIVKHSHVQRWLMKIDDEHLGRGHAYLDVAALPAITMALQLYAATVTTAPGTCHSQIQFCDSIEQVSRTGTHDGNER